MSNTVIWSVVRSAGSVPVRAVEPGMAGIEIPEHILGWAEEHGLSMEDPDVYVLVTPSDEASEIPGEIAYREDSMAADQVALVRAELAGEEAARNE